MRSVGVDNYIQYRMYFNQKKNTLTLQELKQIILRLKQILKLGEQKNEHEDIEDLICEVEDFIDLIGTVTTSLNESESKQSVKQTKQNQKLSIVMDWDESRIDYKVRKEILVQALEHFDGDRFAMAQALGVAETTVRARLKYFNLYKNHNQNEQK